MSNLWKQKQFAKEYSDNATDVDKNWFEHEVNFQSMLEMIPKNSQRVLDYGCGPGEFTDKLAESFPLVDGSDYSQAMIDLAIKLHPEQNFFVWDSVTSLQNVKPYDAIFSKLTIQFIEDLDSFAKALKPLLKTNGTFVFSVAHPMSTFKKVNNYWAVEKYETQVGSYGINSTMIHRDFENYIQPFLANGYGLKEIIELRTPIELSRNHNEPADKLTTPRRLNLSFIKLEN